MREKLVSMKLVEQPWKKARKDRIVEELHTRWLTRNSNMNKWSGLKTVYNAFYGIWACTKLALIHHTFRFIRIQPQPLSVCSCSEYCARPAFEFRYSFLFIINYLSFPRPFNFDIPFSSPAHRRVRNQQWWSPKENLLPCPPECIEYGRM